MTPEGKTKLDETFEGPFVNIFTEPEKATLVKKLAGGTWSLDKLARKFRITMTDTDGLFRFTLIDQNATDVEKMRAESRLREIARLDDIELKDAKGGEILGIARSKSDEKELLKRAANTPAKFLEEMNGRLNPSKERARGNFAGVGERPSLDVFFGIREKPAEKERTPAKEELNEFQILFLRRFTKALNDGTIAFGLSPEATVILGRDRDFFEQGRTAFDEITVKRKDLAARYDNISALFEELPISCAPPPFNAGQKPRPPRQNAA